MIYAVRLTAAQQRRLAADPALHWVPRARLDAFAFRSASSLVGDPAIASRVEGKLQSLTLLDRLHPAVAQAIVSIYGELFKQGHNFYAMAEAHGLGKEVPDTAALLARYEKLFKCDFSLPKDWHQAAGSSKVSGDPGTKERRQGQIWRHFLGGSAR